MKLAAILVAAAILRIVALTQVPPGLDWDEAAVGYNAYSILQTGKDEYGTFLPLLLRSFNDYKLPAIVYLTVPSIAVFGLTVFAIRLPSVLFGVATVGLLYVLALQLTKHRRIALLSALFLAISPWHLQFSRVAFEPNVALFFTVLGSVLLLGAKNDVKVWIGAAGSLSLALYSYHSTKIVVPLLIPILLYTKIQGIQGARRLVPLACGFLFSFLLFVAPLFITSTRLPSQSRLIQTTAINHPNVIEPMHKKLGEDFSQGTLLPTVFHNRILANIQSFVHRYFSHISPQFLIGPEVLNFRLGLKDFGKLYLTDIILLVGGISAIRLVSTKTRLVIAGWLAIGLLPGAFGIEYPHALRSLLAVPVLMILLALGANRLLRASGKIVVLCACVALLLQLALYLHEYYVHFPLYGSFDWQATHMHMARTVASLKDTYPTIIVSTRYFQPHIFYALYTRMDPRTYQRQMHASLAKSKGSLDEIELDTITFRAIDWGRDQELENTVLIVTGDDVPHDVAEEQTIHFPDGGVAWRVIVPR